VWVRFPPSAQKLNTVIKYTQYGNKTHQRNDLQNI